MPKAAPVPAAQPSAAGRPQPQTTLQPPGGPFLRHAEDGAKRIYVDSARALGGLVAQPLTSVPGYIKGWRVTFQAAAGVNGSVTVAAAADAPYNLVQQTNVWDAFGTPLIAGPGYETLFLIPMFSGQFADPMGVSPAISSLPSFSAISVGGAGTGNFKFKTYIPLEFSMAVGTIGGANASLQPKVQFQYNTSAVVYTTAPGTPPTVTCRVNERFYWLPESVDVAPPMEGTTQQWFIQQTNPPVGSASNQNCSIPRLGGYLSTLIFILRDSTGARIDQYPDPLSFFIDGVSRMDLDLDEIYDDIYMAWGGVTRPTGVIAFSRKTSLSQAVMGLFDSLEKTLSTNPGTSVQIGGTWGTISNAPAQLNVLTGLIIPASVLVQGLPEV